VSELALRSFKLLVDERRIRLVPTHHPDGRPFDEPGIDLLAAEADALFEASRPVLRWLEELEPGAKVRSLSFDFPRGRALVTLRFPSIPGGGAGTRTDVHALRIDESSSPELFDRARHLAPTLGSAGVLVLRRRAARAAGATGG
jgi:hypothetical protein